MKAWREMVTIGDCVLYLGDCRDILPSIGAADVVITDPPYGAVETHARHLSTITLKDGTAAGQPLGFTGISGDNLVSLAASWVAVARRWVVFTCEWQHAHLLADAGLLVRLGIWRKPDGAPQFTGDRPGMGWEAVAICHRPGRKRWNGGGAHAFWTVPKSASGSGHPTEKPLGLVGAWIRDFTDAGETVVDPFMGSGTTGVACVNWGRRFVGIEVDPAHFATACERIRHAVASPRLLLAQKDKAQQEELI